MQLTEKEKSLLKDMKDAEKLCIDKYTYGAQRAKDPQIKQLFISIAQTEQNHYDTLTKIENGQCPPPPAGSSASGQSVTFSENYGAFDSDDKKNDAFLTKDLLASEKHASHLYDTCVFEFKDDNIRQQINHIQKEEQQHGKQLYDYMQKNNMYN